MTVRMFTLSLCLAALTGGAALAQDQPPNTPEAANTAQAQPPRAGNQRPQQPAPPAAPEPRAPRREGQPVNIKVELTISDQRAGTQALKKTVTVVTGDELAGFIRSTANYTGIGPVPLNVDIQPRILADNKIRLVVNMQYNLPDPALLQDPAKAGQIALRTTEIHENLALIVENGKPIVAAQSADPVGDRQVTVEVKATILR
jgi:hypothetical protein